jgi:hypothetical protein
MPSLKSGIRYESLPTFTKLPRNFTVLAARVEEEVDLAESFGL